MTISKTNKVIIAAGTQTAAGSTKAAPGVTGTATDCTLYYGGELNYRITNGNPAPTVAVSITFQTSPDNTNWYDYYTVGGDITASTTYSGSIPLDTGAMWVRAITYGNQTNAVTVEAGLQAISGV